MKLYKIVKKIQEKYPQKYNELAAEPWFKKNQGNLGIWARARLLGWKIVFNWDWFPDAIKQEMGWLRILSFITIIWIIFIFLIIFGMILLSAR